MHASGSQRQNHNNQPNPPSSRSQTRSNHRCHITTGIFAWIAANAAEEQKQQGITNITPYWRTLKTGGIINEKYLGGVESQKMLLEQEGHTVIKKGKNFVVKDYLNVIEPLNY
ncbi:MAG: hypothetical protein ACQCN3_07120 [Candidatus Bathyarchaeia archaeon]